MRHTLAAFTRGAPLPQPLAWPAAPLTCWQLRRRAAQEQAMRHRLVARWPAGVQS